LATFYIAMDRSAPNPSSTPASAPSTGGNAPRSEVDQHRVQRVELILQQLDSLPTLSALALRLLEVIDSDSSSGKDAVKLVNADPALAAKVLKLCRCSERGRALNITTVDRAVLMLGFDTLRSAIFSVQIFELLERTTSPGGEFRSASTIFDPSAYWQHSFAVACVCERLAGTGALSKVNKADAFLGGLLHDLGVLALHVLLPKSLDRVCQYAEVHGVSLDQACNQIIGLDTHTAGRRLAEHWRLPHSLGDVLWLHGQRWDSLPELPHKASIGLVSLADAIARRNCIAPAGHAPRGEDIAALCAQLGLDQRLADEAALNLQQEVAERAESLGLKTSNDTGRLLGALGRANESLGRINSSMRQRTILAQQQTQTLNAITQFHDSAAPSGSVLAVMGKVIESAVRVFGGGFFAILYQPRSEDLWQLVQFATDGRPLRTELIEPPPGSTAVADFADNTQVSAHVLSIFPWLSDYLGDARDLREIHFLPLRCGWGVNAVLLHDCEVDGRDAREQLEALGHTWAAAIAAAAQHEGAKTLGDQLAQANRILIETQDELARSKALASLGEIAAGAAHEMNNPLTVISGRSQLLASSLTEPTAKLMAEQIVEQSHRISDMITALRTFAEPTRPQITSTNISQLLDGVVKQAKARYKNTAAIKVVVEQGLPLIHIDSEQIGRAVSELLRNAIESQGSAHIEVRVQINTTDGRLNIYVTDDGSGLTPHVLAHAFDPFFSAKPAGRQPGLGLAQARRLVEAHGGTLTLENGHRRGAIATIRLDKWRGQAVEKSPPRKKAA
jgi:signal transduction histidine kinase/HD-like signal output (HDOD) protein